MCVGVFMFYCVCLYARSCVSTSNQQCTEPYTIIHMLHTYLFIIISPSPECLAGEAARGWGLTHRGDAGGVVRQAGCGEQGQPSLRCHAARPASPGRASPSCPQLSDGCELCLEPSLVPRVPNLPPRLTTPRHAPSSISVLPRL